MNDVGFKQLDDFVIHPVLSPVLAALFLLGVYRVSTFLFHCCCNRRKSCAEAAAVYLTGLGVTASLVHVLSQLGYAHYHYLHWFGLGICVAGLLNAFSLFAKLRVWRDAGWVAWKKSDRWQRLDMILLGAVVVVYALCVSSPPTDADSLDYHLGVPLWILRHHGFVESPAWFYLRLIGLGEYLNLVGLALGTDTLGAMLSFSAVLWMLLVLLSLCAQHGRRILVAKLVMAVPVLLFFLSSQKPQLIGCLGVMIAVIIMYGNGTNGRSLQPGGLWLALGSLFFALSLKYSFYISGGVAWLFMLHRARLVSRLRMFLVASLLLYSLLVFPIHLANYCHYGNPVSPFAEALFAVEGRRAHSVFVAALKNYSEGFGFPLALLVPRSVGQISTILGLGCFSLLLIAGTGAGRRCGPVWAGMAMVVLVIAAGQRTSRFFLEPYLLFAAAVAVAAGLPSWQKWYSRALSLQLACVMALAAIGAWVLFPGAVSWDGRRRTMEKHACHYAIMRWADTVLPPDALLFLDLRSNAISPRPFVANEYRYLVAVGDREWCGIVRSLPRNNVFLLTDNINGRHLLPVLPTAICPAPRTFPLGTRNPFNNIRIKAALYRLDVAAMLKSVDDIDRSHWRE